MSLSPREFERGDHRADMLLPGKDEELGNLNVIHELILPHHEASEANAEDYRDKLPKRM